MKRLLTLCFGFLLLFCSVTAYSQRLETPIKIIRPDLSGKWKMTYLMSGNQIIDEVDPSDSSLFMIIEQNLPVISITFQSQKGDKVETEGNAVLYSDGRGDEYPKRYTLSTSTTVWQGNKLVLTNYSHTNGRREMVNIIEFELSANRDRLVGTDTGFKVTTNNRTGERVTYIDEDTKGLAVVFVRVNTAAAAAPVKMPTGLDRKN